MDKNVQGKKNKYTQKTGVATLISDKTDFQSTMIKKDKEEHYIIVKCSVQQENVIILNMYAPKSSRNHKASS